MGSFATSLHVKTEQAAEIATAIEAVMNAAGFVDTNEEPDDEAMAETPPSLRAIRVLENGKGWVGILDSDFTGSVALAARLSEKLDAWVFHFAVNDSDAWEYDCFRAGELVDKFDSAGEDSEITGTVDVTGEFAAMMQHGDLVEMAAQLNERMAEVRRRSDEELPDEIRKCRERIAAGTGSADDVVRYREWRVGQGQRIQQEADKLLKVSMPTFQPGPKSEKPSGDHVERLRPVLPPETGDSEVFEALSRRSMFAEDDFSQFMKVAGIEPFFSRLSYSYFEECEQSDLTAVGLRATAHLKFRRDPTAT